jgi:hypothetical protein
MAAQRKTHRRIVRVPMAEDAADRSGTTTGVVGGGCERCFFDFNAERLARASFFGCQP